MSYTRCLGCGKIWGCVCYTPIRTLPHLEPATTQNVVDEKRLRADRRERIATACLAGLIACPRIEGNSPELVEAALSFTDALIARLDKEAKP